jgi:Ca-activated chloride channel family protein
VRQSLDAADYFSGFRGTAIGDALAAAVDLARATVSGTPDPTVSPIALTTGSSDGPVSILFLSDGTQTRGELEPLQGAQRASNARIPVYTIALGTPGGTLKDNFGGPGSRAVPPDPETLKAIASRTGGKFFDARSSDALRSAYADLGSKLGRAPAREELTSECLLAAALLLLAAGIASRPWVPRLP